MAPTTRKRPTKATKAEVNLSDDEKEQLVDEPDELKDLSEDEWTPVSKKGRKSAQRSGPLSKKKKVNFDEDDSDEEDTKKKKPTKAAAKGKSAKTNGKKAGENSEEEEDSEEDLDDEEDSEEGGSDDEKGDDASGKEFPPGSFVVLKTEFDSMPEPPIWRIDGKTLLQKYLPHKEEKDEDNLYISTCSFNFWNSKIRDNYYPATVKYRHQKGIERVVEFQRDSVLKNGADKENTATATDTAPDTAPADEE